MRHRLAVTREKPGSGSLCVRLSPPRPGHQELAARRRHRVIDGDVGTALRQHLGRHQAGGAGADDGDVF